MRRILLEGWRPHPKMGQKKSKQRQTSGLRDSIPQRDSYEELPVPPKSSREVQTQVDQVDFISGPSDADPINTKYRDPRQHWPTAGQLWDASPDERFQGNADPSCHWPTTGQIRGSGIGDIFHEDGGPGKLFPNAEDIWDGVQMDPKQVIYSDKVDFPNVDYSQQKRDVKPTAV